MATDLSRTPNSGIRTQLCGDAHLSNFGAFGSPERTLVFDVNDFDETAPGPWEWDVKRLAASFEIAGRDNGFSTEGAGSGRAGHGPLVPRGDGRLRRDAQPRGLVREPPDRAGAARVHRRSRPEAAEEGRGRTRQGAHERQHARLREADPHRRRRAPHHQRPAADRADRRAAPPGREPRPDRERHPRPAAALPAHAGQRPAHPARAVPLRRPRPQGRSGSEASAPATGSPSSWASTARIRCSSRSRRRSRRCSSGSWARASTRTTASASSQGSG